MNYKDGKITLTITISVSRVFWLFTMLLLFVLFFIGGPSHYSSPVFKEFWNIGHIVFFAITTHKLIDLIRHKPTLVIVFFSLLYCFVLGGAIELLQSKIGRSFDFHDLYRDALGTFLALAIYAYRQCLPNKRNYLGYSFLIISALLIIIDQNKFYQTIKIDIEARNNFPNLASFENENQLKRWLGNGLSLSSEHVLTGLYSMRVELDAKTRYPGISLTHMPSNWEGYNYLLVIIYNPNKDALKLTTKITDYKHDVGHHSYNNRYSKGFTLLGAQWTTIKIPLKDIKNSPKGRKLALDDISRLGLFTTGLTENKVIYIDSVTLI